MPHITHDMKSPSEYADMDPDKVYDCTLWIGPFLSDAPWSMYSYERPASILWNAIAGEFYRNGWTDEEIKEWLQSKEARWALDGMLGEDIENLGREFAKKIAPIRR